VRVGGTGTEGDLKSSTEMFPHFSALDIIVIAEQFFITATDRTREVRGEVPK
jgi:hypothetical protein